MMKAKREIIIASENPLSFFFSSQFPAVFSWMAHVMAENVTRQPLTPLFSPNDSLTVMMQKQCDEKTVSWDARKNLIQQDSCFCINGMNPTVTSHIWWWRWSKRDIPVYESKGKKSQNATIQIREEKDVICICHLVCLCSPLLVKNWQNRSSHSSRIRSGNQYGSTLALIYLSVIYFNQILETVFPIDMRRRRRELTVCLVSPKQEPFITRLSHVPVPGSSLFFLSFHLVNKSRSSCRFWRQNIDRESWTWQKEGLCVGGELETKRFVSTVILILCEPHLFHLWLPLHLLMIQWPLHESLTLPFLLTLTSKSCWILRSSARAAHVFQTCILHESILKLHFLGGRNGPESLAYRNNLLIFSFPQRILSTRHSPHNTSTLFQSGQ